MSACFFFFSFCQAGAPRKTACKKEKRERIKSTRKIKTHHQQQPDRVGVRPGPPGHHGPRPPQPAGLEEGVALLQRPRLRGFEEGHQLALRRRRRRRRTFAADDAVKNAVCARTPTAKMCLRDSVKR